MLSICKYLTEQNMDMDTIRQARKRFMLAKGIGKGTPVSGPSTISGLEVVSAPEPVAAPTVVKKALSTVAGPTEISADAWAGKFGGAAKKAVQTAIENK
jgi:hypothetical protein